jgi:hypothetical protein
MPINGLLSCYQQVDITLLLPSGNCTFRNALAQIVFPLSLLLTQLYFYDHFEFYPY